jgi:NADH-quinone oxidoreductase subunit M
MKLGGYGCLKVDTLQLTDAAKEYSLIIFSLALMGILYGAFATAWQKDLKMLNAYSSVSHCGFVLLGLGVLTPTAMTGAVLQMVSHGLMTALFFAAIGMLYERTHTRMKDELGGLLKVMPFISTVFMIAGLCSLGLPGLSGFAAEITVFVGAFQSPEKLFKIMTLLATASLVVTAVYILRATGVSLLGPITKNEYESLTDARWNEKLASIVLLIAILGMGVAPWWLAEMIRQSLN